MPTSTTLSTPFDRREFRWRVTQRAQPKERTGHLKTRRSKPPSSAPDAGGLRQAREETSTEAENNHLGSDGIGQCRERTS